MTKIKPIPILIVSTIMSLIGSITTDFGRIPDYNQNSGVSGTVFVIGIIMIPIFVKEQREFVWSKKGLIVLSLALLINLPFALVTIINHYNA